ncbi:IclR family transcriptional regulator [Rhodoferax sp.]|uniref:IclR family transcriptional regulator n=1 Tax=Rhodoferax sp. TaxID=50421 RepID=UPI00262376CF|nr:IclR family transcriptional regulator [Rhodoferax sp.]MDD3937188.1 IclR family transcriptional regulator [Rhodoferax sp.]
MSSNLSRGLAVLEFLSHHVEGLSLNGVAEPLGLPRSAAHRVLAELIEAGYVKHEGDFSPYRLTFKLASIGLSYMAESGVVELVQPTIDKLAISSGELARMSIVDGTKLIWVAKAQGARGGLRYDVDSDPGEEVRLFCSSNGLAWLSTLPDEKALEIIMKQGFNPEDYGPNAPKTIQDLLACLAACRKKGYAVAHDMYEEGIAAIAAPVFHAVDKRVIGAVSIAGPESRLKGARLEDFAPMVLDAAREISALSLGIRAAAK